MENRILIVDDTAENIDILTSILEDFRLYVSLDGEDAIETANQENPDLILLDIMMPGMSGYEVCSILKSQDKTKDIPIIFITSKTDTDSIVKGFEYGAVDYVTKPFNSSELMARVRTQLELKKSRDDIQEYLQKIEAQNNIITSSVQYAQRIQNASLPDIEDLNRDLKDYFILFKPRDIVSGDFYWIKKIENKIIIAIADCTGHGVPGAFMSMLGTAFLNEIVLRENITQPSLILSQLRENIIDSLSQNEHSEVFDGMDISVATIDLKTNILEFSGANNYGYLLRNNEIIKLECDHMPVSYFSKMKPFSNMQMDVRKGDILYLFSDGFIDQFGGAKDKKLKAPSFKKLLLEIQNLNMEEQKQKLDEFFVRWKGEQAQVDDVSVFGLKF